MPNINIDVGFFYKRTHIARVHKPDKLGNLNNQSGQSVWQCFVVCKSSVFHIQAAPLRRFEQSGPWSYNTDDVIPTLAPLQ